MNNHNVIGCQTTSDKIQEQIRSNTERIMDFCTKENDDATFMGFEKQLMVLVFQLGCLFFQLFLAHRHEKMDYSKWVDTGQYYKRNNPVVRKIKTAFGIVTYWRTYLVKKDDNSGGFHPLDAVLGLTRDGFSPFIVSLATRLATRVSFGTCTILFECFYNWSPSTDSIEQLVLGLGREAGAYMEVVEPPEGYKKTNFNAIYSGISNKVIVVGDDGTILTSDLGMSEWLFYKVGSENFYSVTGR